jgi:hypothetical protein
MKSPLRSIAVFTLLVAPVTSAFAAQDFNVSRSNKDKGLAAPHKGQGKDKVAAKVASPAEGVVKLEPAQLRTLRGAKCTVKYGQCWVFGKAAPGASLTKTDCAAARVKYGQCMIFSGVIKARGLERIKKGTNMLLPSICTEKQQPPASAQCWVFSEAATKTQTEQR